MTASECPSCHTTGGRPHTDYCKRPGVCVLCGNVVDGPECQASHTLRLIEPLNRRTT